MSARGAIVRQFGRPRGVLGSLAGWVMAHRPSNRRRNLWTVRLLAIEPGHTVLELGCGPGVALAACAEAASGGLVVGIDHSPVMLAQAGARNQAAITDGRVRLVAGGLEAVWDLGLDVDRILAVNVLQFMPDPAAAIRVLVGRLRPGGVIAVTHQPRTRGASRADGHAAADRMRERMAACGLEAVRIEELALRPVPAFAVIGHKPAAGTALIRAAAAA